MSASVFKTLIFLKCSISACDIYGMITVNLHELFAETSVFWIIMLQFHSCGIVILVC